MNDKEITIMSENQIKSFVELLQFKAVELIKPDSFFKEKKLGDRSLEELNWAKMGFRPIKQRHILNYLIQIKYWKELCLVYNKGKGKGELNV